MIGIVASIHGCDLSATNALLITDWQSALRPAAKKERATLNPQIDAHSLRSRLTS